MLENKKFQASMGSNSDTMDMDEEGDEMNNVFDQISQAQVII